jgi:hypothetical protein
MYAAEGDSPVIVVLVLPAGSELMRKPCQLLGAVDPGAIKTSIESNVLPPNVHVTTAEPFVILPTLVIVGLLHAVNATDCHAVHALGNNPACSVRART